MKKIEPTTRDEIIVCRYSALGLGTDEFFDLVEADCPDGATIDAARTHAEDCLGILESVNSLAQRTAAQLGLTAEEVADVPVDRAGILKKFLPQVRALR